MWKDITNKRFGRLVALTREAKYPDGRSAWRCKCDCGNETIVALPSLTRGLTRSCGCLQREAVYKGCGDLGGQQWARIIDQASRRHHKVIITIQEAWGLFKKQQGKCALSGIDIHLARNYLGKKSGCTASLDRIDSSKGYTIDNVWWVHKDINIMKNKYDVQYFLELCRKVIKYNDTDRALS